jgi:hypothetical protein
VIYAIRAVGTEFVKVGKAVSVGKRLKELETGCPFELHIEAVANWHDSEERRLHRYLEGCYVRGEWFRDSPRLEDVIRLMRDENGREAWQTICESLGWSAPVEPAAEPKRRKRKDTRFFDPKPLLSPAEKRRQERAEYWRIRAIWTNKNNTASPSDHSNISPQSSELK